MFKKAVVLVIFVLMATMFFQGQTSSQKPLEITYIANGGFLIEYDTKKILIDALHSWPNFQSTPDEVFSDMYNSRPPFENIDLVLVTHRHPDHFNSDMIEMFLRKNPEAKFIATPRYVECLRAVAELPIEQISGQIRIVDIKKGEVLDISEKGIDLKIFGLEHHGSHSNMLNFGFLIKIGDKTFLHEGDSGIGNEYFRSAAFNLKGIDVLFENDPYRKDQERQKVIRDYIKPKYRIGMHIQPKNLERFIREVGEKFPDEIIFKKPMEKRVFK